ncbi:MAG TPA: hypothetical protein VI233_07775, partial [Puia sp.]
GISNWNKCFDVAEMTFNNFIPLQAPGYCNSGFQATGSYTVKAPCNGVMSTIQTGTFTMTRDCPILDCHGVTTRVIDPLICNIPENTPVNPYILGILGNWRIQATYKFITDRKYPAAGLQQYQGVYYDTLGLCLPPLPGFALAVPASKARWQARELAAVIDPHGRSLETFDPLKIPQGQLHGYGYNMPVAAADNASYYEMAFDGFEDYDYLKNIQSPLSGCQLPPHFKFENLSGGSIIDDAISHSGKKSLLVVNGSPVSLERTVGEDCTYPLSRTDISSSQYLLKKCDIVKQFSPLPGKEYLVSLWVNEQRSNSDLDESRPLLTVEFKDAAGNPVGTPLPFKTKGPIIDDWQQLNETFTIPADARKIKIQLTAYGARMSVDDIRIQPFNSTMKTYVYDPTKLRLMAVLDEQNYASFYEYDNEGQLTREKKETERGIMTVREIRSAKPKSGKLAF